MRRAALLLAPAALAAALAGCSNQPGDITAAGQRVLVPKVQQVRETAAHGSYSQLQTVVAQLKRLVDRQRKAGNVSDTRAAAIDDAADALLLDARPTTKPSSTPTPTESATPTPTQTPTPTPTPTTTPTATATPTSSASAQPTSTVTVP